MEERKLFDIEGAIKELTLRAERHVMEFDQCVNNACKLLISGQANDAMSWINKAIEQDEAINELMTGKGLRTTAKSSK